MPIRYRITTVRAGTGEALPLLTTGVTCVVGANNAGKSQLLKDLTNHSRDGDRAQMIVLSAATHESSIGSKEEAELWLKRHGVPSEYPSVPPNYTFFPSQSGVGLDMFHAQLEYSQQAGNGLNQLEEAFIRRISAGSLSAYASGELQTSWSPETNRNWLLRQLYSNGDLEHELSRLVLELFATPVFMDRQNFPPRMRAGEIGTEAPPADAVTTDYARAVASVTALDEQGDGLRSFTGLALVVLALSPEVLLLDEPESFLHPGQARAVGRWMAGVAESRDMQIVVATHDKDFLIGLLSGNSQSKVEVFRIIRDVNGARLRTITSEKLKNYWSDPVLRYSNALQGLFHERVVVCEGDADCRFYSAVTEEIAAARGMRHVADDTLFVPSGGKNGMSKLIGVLSDLGVEAAVIADFDVLDNESTVSLIVRSLGYEWSPALAEGYAAMVKHVPQPPEAFWRDVKKGGLARIPRGGARKAFTELVDLLEQVQLHVVRHGELEDFYPLEGKGSAWIAAALAAEAHKGRPAQDLLQRVIPSLAETDGDEPAMDGEANGNC